MQKNTRKTKGNREKKEKDRERTLPRMNAQGIHQVWM